MSYLPNFYFAEFMAEIKISAKINSESSSMAKVRSQQRIKVMTISPTLLNDKQLRHKRVAETEKNGLQGRISCRDTIMRSRHRRRTSLVTIDF